MRVRGRYLALAVVVFVVLVIIETQLDSGFVRFTGGDVLVVVLVYAVIMAVTLWRPVVAAAAALGIAYLVEVSQALNIVERLGLEPNRITDVVLGNTFTWSDIVAYTAGAALALLVDAAVFSRAH